MKILKSGKVTVFDVDNTLVMWNDDYRIKRSGLIELKYGGEKVYLKPHKFHPLFLKHCYERGDFVIVWSQNGWQWAEQVVKVLGLEECVCLVMSKPVRHIDDKLDLADIVGNRIYIKDN